MTGEAKKALLAVSRLDGEFVIIGGAAIALHGFKRIVRDVDLLAHPDDTERLASLLEEQGWSVEEVEPGRQYDATLAGAVNIEVHAALSEERRVLEDAVFLPVGGSGATVPVATVAGIAWLKSALPDPDKKHVRDVEALLGKPLRKTKSVVKKYR